MSAMKAEAEYFCEAYNCMVEQNPCPYCGEKHKKI